MLWPPYQMLLMHQKVLGTSKAEAVLSAGAETVLVRYSAERVDLSGTVQQVNMLYGLTLQDLTPNLMFPVKLSSTSLWLRYWASYPFSLLAP